MAVCVDQAQSHISARRVKQRERPLVEPGPLHLTRPGDQLDIETPQADLSIYDNTATNTEQK